MRKCFPWSNLPSPEPLSEGFSLQQPASMHSSDQFHSTAPAHRCSAFCTCTRVENNVLRRLPHLSISSEYAVANDERLPPQEYKYPLRGYNGFQANPTLPADSNRGNWEPACSVSEPPGS